MAMILRSYSHLGDWGVGVVCSIPAAGLTRGLANRMQQNQPVRWGGPIWGPKRLHLLLPLPYSHEAAKSGQTHWLTSNTDPHHPTTPAGSHRCEPDHPRCPATLSKSCQHQPCSPRAADPPANRTDSGAHVITVFGVFCGGLLRTKANAHCSLRVSHGSAPPAQEGQANRPPVTRLAEATGNLQPTLPQTGALLQDWPPARLHGPCLKLPPQVASGTGPPFFQSLSCSVLNTFHTLNSAVRKDSRDGRQIFT